MKDWEPLDIVVLIMVVSLFILLPGMAVLIEIFGAC